MFSAPMLELIEERVRRMEDVEKLEEIISKKKMKIKNMKEKIKEGEKLLNAITESHRKEIKQIEKLHLERVAGLNNRVFRESMDAIENQAALCFYIRQTDPIRKDCACPTVILELVWRHTISKLPDKAKHLGILPFIPNVGYIPKLDEVDEYVSQFIGKTNIYGFSQIQSYLLK